MPQNIRTWLTLLGNKILEVITSKIAVGIVFLALSVININFLATINNLKTEHYTQNVKSLHRSQVVTEIMNDLSKEILSHDKKLSRIYIALFHNGIESFGGTSFIKFSISNEVITNSFYSPAYTEIQNSPINIVYPFFDKLESGNCVIINNTENIASNITKSFFIRRGVESAIVCPIIMKRGTNNLFDGVVVAEFNSILDGSACIDCEKRLKDLAGQISNYVAISDKK